MPPRSNDFQRLIYRIYEQIVPSGASVTESAMLADEDSKSPTEIDVLIEHTLAGVPVRIAIECRDHHRVSDRQWIDQLIGKYASLPVDVVVAVSRTGFSRAAESKAAANRIVTRTLLAAIETDWPDAMIKLGVGLVEIRLEKFQLSPMTSPPWTETEIPVEVLTPTGNSLTFQQFIDELSQKIGQHVSRQFFDSAIGKPIADLNTRGAWEGEPEAPGVFLVNREGTHHQVKALKMSIGFRSAIAKAPAKRYLFGDAGVTTSFVKGAKIEVIQVAGKEPTVTITATDLSSSSGRLPVSRE